MKDILLRKGPYALLDKATVALIGFVYVILSARMISETEYGALMLAVSIYNFLILYSDSGTGNALIKYAAEGRERERVLSNAFRIKMVSAAIVSVLSIIFAFTLPSFFHIPELFPLFLYMPVLIFSMILNTFFKQGLQAEYRIREILLVDLLGLAVISVLFALFSLTGLLKSALHVMFILSIANLSSAAYGLKLSGYRPEWMKDPEWHRKIGRFSLFSSASSLGSILYTRTDMIMLGIFLGAVGVAEYSSAWVLASAVYLIPQAAYMVVFPAASELSVKGRKREMSTLYWKGVGYSLALSVPASLILMLFPEQILNLIYSGRYMDSADVLRVLALWGIIRPFGNITGAFIEGMGKPHVNASIIWITAGVNVVANSVLIPIFGVVGAAYASIISFLIGAPVGMIYLFSHIRRDGK